MILSPEAVVEKDPSYLVLDFGKEISGCLILKSKQLSEALVITGESLEELQTPLRTYRVFSTGSSFSGTDYTAFRYVKVIFQKGSEFEEIKADHNFYPVEYKGSFKLF